MEVLKIIFYSLGLVCLLYEFNKLTDPKAVIKRLKESKEARKNKREIHYSKEDTIVLLLGLFYMLWCTVGLFTVQWPLFVFMWIMALIMGVLPKRAWWMVLDSIISIPIIIFLMVNSRLKIDLVEQILIWTL